MWQKVILKPFWRLTQNIRCHVNVKKSGFSELLSLSLVCRKRTVDSTTLKEGGERQGPGMWSDSTWPPDSALPLSPLGSQGATPPHYNGVYRLQWPHPAPPPSPVQAARWNSAPQHCQVQHYKHSSHGRRSKEVLFSGAQWKDQREGSRAGVASWNAPLCHCLWIGMLVCLFVCFSEG